MTNSATAMATGRRFARVAFQGEPGAFSEEAACNLLGPDVQTIPCPTFEALFAAIARETAEAILAPIENTLAGTIARACDLLWDSALFIQAETIHRVRHCLVGARGATLQTIRSVQSHPAALAQCENFFVRHSLVKRVAGEDTAGSVREVMAAGDPSCAAIASRRAAEIYGAQVMLEDIEDNAENYTRFLLLAPKISGIAEADKMTVLLELAHRPGSLHRALAVFSNRGMNLLKIESRPLVGKPWHYRFFLDVETPPDSQVMQATMRELEAECEALRLLGWYRAAARPPLGAEAAAVETPAPAVAGGAR